MSAGLCTSGPAYVAPGSSVLFVAAGELACRALEALSGVARALHVRVTGPFAPGVTSVQIGFSLPDNSSSYTLRQRWPAAFERPFVAVEKIGDMRLESPQLGTVENFNAEGGKVFLLGPEITFRAQPHGTFKFLFNSIYYGTSVPAAPGTTTTTAGQQH